MFLSGEEVTLFCVFIVVFVFFIITFIIEGDFFECFFLLFIILVVDVEFVKL